MSKKDYQKIAKALFDVRRWRGADHVTFQDAIDVLARTFTEDNPRFDRERFEDAVRTGSCRGMKAIE